MLQMVLLLFIVLDPFGNLVAINALLQGMDAKKRRVVVLRESAIALLILLTFVFAGETIMSALGLKAYALGISGGIVLFMIAMGMVFPARRVMDEKDFGDPFIVPVAIPFIAGPSTISLILLLAQKYDQLMVAGAVVIAASISAVILAISPTIYSLLGDRGTRAMERLMGMLLVMMSVQMVLDGIQAYQLDVPVISCLTAERGWMRDAERSTEERNREEAGASGQCVPGLEPWNEGWNDVDICLWQLDCGARGFSKVKPRMFRTRFTALIRQLL